MSYPVVKAVVTSAKSPEHKRKYQIGSVLIGLCIVGLVGLLTIEPVKALTKSLSPQDLLSGTSQYGEVRLTNGNSTIELQQGAVGSWDTSTSTGLQNIPTMVYGTTSMEYGPNDTVYYMSNISNTCHFFRYDIEAKDWTALDSAPVGCSSGASLVYNGSSSIYYLPGGNTSYLFRYDIHTDNWVRLADMQAQIGGISYADFVDRNGVKSIYLFRGGGSSSFWRYDIASNIWINMAPFPSSLSVTNGISMAWDGADYIYALSNQLGEFKRYSVSSNSWSDLARYTAQSDLRSTMLHASGKLYVAATRVNEDQAVLNTYTIASGAWESAAVPAPSTNYDWPAPAATDGTRYIYTQAGTEIRPQLFRYDMVTKTWNTRSVFRTTGRDDYVHSTIYDGNQNVYYTAGASQGGFTSVYKHHLPSNVTEEIGPQFNTNSGWRGVHSAGSLYLLSNRETAFRKYDLANNTFTDLAPAPFVANNGADIIDGGDGYLYIAIGCRTNFYRYNIATNVWENRASIINRSVCSGGGMTRINRTIYVLHGDSSGYFSVYNMDTNAWTNVGPLPTGKVDHGGFISSDASRYIYLGLSTRTEDHARRVWRFDTVNKTWLRVADAPASTSIEASAFYDVTNNKLYVSQGTVHSNLWSWSPSTSAYTQTGTWYSKKYDFDQVQSWGPLAATISGSGTVSIQTRSSSSGKQWSAWQPVTGTTINSPPNRYLQLKVVLNGPGDSTPSVSDIQINYNQESSPPNLPAQFTAKSKPDGEDLVSGTTYEWQHPYFSWAGATDGVSGSGVKGYYVYFGTDSNADPVTQGNFQTTTNYTVTTPMTAGEVYYVRIKAADKLGNISGAATFFSYRYFYISPPGSFFKTSANDFNGGVNTNVAISNDAMKLKQNAQGSWATGAASMFPDKTRSAASTIVDEYLYTLRGNSSSTFWRYHTVSQNWETLADAPAAVSDGSSLTWDGQNYLYALRGNGTNHFYRYNIQDNAWEELPVLPAIAQHGSDIAHIGNNTVAVFFTGVREFYTYNTQSNTYTVKQSYPFAVPYAGSGIWYDGDDSVYAYLGAHVTSNPNDNTRSMLVKYSISADSWRVLGQPPVGAAYTQNNLVGDGRGNLYVATTNTFSHLNRNQQLMRYSIENDSWSEVEGMNSRVEYGALTTDNKRYIYIIPSVAGNSSKLIKYDTWDNRFTPNTASIDKWERTPWDAFGNAWGWSSNNATTAVYDGSTYLYALGSSEQSFSMFARYNVNTGKTDYLPPPFYIAHGGSLAIINGELYYSRANTTTQLFRFDFQTEQWQQMSDVPVGVYRPGSASFLAAGSQAFQVVGWGGRGFYQYTPNASGGTWVKKADVPGTVYYGSAVYDSNGHIYLLRGNGTTDFYRYTIATDTWSSMSSLPVGTSYGSSLAISGGKIIAVRGDNTRDSYVYDIASNSWTGGEQLPDRASYNAQLIKISEEKAYLLPANGSPDLWQFNFPAADRGFQGIAQHISEPAVVTGMFDYASISADVELPANTKVEFWTRSSADGTNWNDWVIADNTKYYSGSLSAQVRSVPQKYTQLKVMLYSHDNVSSPTVHSYNLHYYFDVDPPSNPTTMEAYSDETETTTVESNTWYKHANPTFDWPGAGEPGGSTDGPLGSNLKGYWVYFGNDQTAMPRTAGVFVTDTRFISNLTTSGTYYLRIQAEDMTGNVDPSVYAPIVYKFDNTAPTTPSLITVTPGGYTTQNNFTFDWPAAFDGNSGIAGYCYHTGDTSGPFATEICQPGRTLADVSAAYRTGTNVFYLRTIDQAGNYSAAYTTVSYYYSTDPPSPPTNLRAIPPTSTENMFAFAWDLPVLYSGDPDQLTYCYSVNELPADHNTTCTGERFISPFRAATKQGTNVLYMVTKDEAGNVNWTNYTSANFIANTVSPGIPLNLVVNDTSDQSAGRWSLTTTWSKPTFEGNGIAYYLIERSLDGHTFAEIGKTSTTAFVDLDVEPNTTYYYRVRAADNVDNRGGVSGTASGIPKGNFSSPPDIVAAPSVTAESGQASVRWVTDRESSSFVYYGTSPTDLSQSKGTLTPVTEHSQTINGLQPSTTYYYRVQSFDNERNYDLKDAYSQIYSFKTSEAAKVFNVKTDSTTLSSTIVTWQTSVPTKTRVEYGTATTYSGAAVDESDSYSTNHIFRLDGLSSGTDYHFRIVSKTQFGSTIYSDDYSFTTLARPSISNIRFQPLTDEASTAVRVTWTTNVPTTSTLRYRGSGTSKEVSSSQLTTNHSMDVRDLTSSTDYVFNAEGRDMYGNLAASEDQQWQSTFDTRSPAVSKLSVGMTTTQGSNRTRAQLIISWKTDEPATSQVNYDLAKAGKHELKRQTPLNTEPTTNHVVVISNLELAEIYKIQVISRDLNGNSTYGKTMSVVTPDREVNVLDSVLTILEKVFRF